MSYIDNRNSGPQVYNYGDNTYQRQSYPQETQQIIYRPSVQQTVQPVQTVVVSNPQRTSQAQRGSRAGEVVSAEKRFTNYHLNEYKYNLFSLIDQPWNRCLQIGKCGNCPGNQCITRQARKGVWSLL